MSFLLLSVPALVAEAPKVDTGDTAWVLASAALVMLMVPAVGLFYGGMVRKKNALSTIMFSFAILALISVQWVLFGYSLAFGPDVKGVIGSLAWLGLMSTDLLGYIHSINYETGTKFRNLLT